uniref:Uncharacterized protein n=1 Tax=Meloidogyne floridensis TaxID=298350 RepID=A0A915P063_9BILA
MCRRRHSANVKRRRSSAASSSSNSRRSSSTTLLIGPPKREKSDNEVNVECPSTLLAQNITKKQNGVSPNFILPTLTDKYNGQIEQKTCIDTNNPVQLILREISDASFATFL